MGSVIYTKSVVLNKFGGFDNIQVCSWPVNTENYADSDYVEVTVSHCGVNFADIYLRKGLIPSIKTPHVLGLECVGIVKNIGSKVTTIKRGQRVLCYQGSGGLYRETVFVPEKCCFLIPDDISDEDAVSLPANYLTAYFCLFYFGNLKPGHKILIHSCAGGVGLAAVQLAKTIDNVTVVGTASIFKHEYLSRNGVKYVINSNNYYEHLKVSSMLDDGGFDIILDTLGCSNIPISTSLLRPLGKVVIIGANSIVQGDNKLSFWELLKMWWTTRDINVTGLITKNICVAGLHLDQLIETCPQVVHSTMTHIFTLCRQNIIKPKIDSIWSIDEVIDAMKILSTRKNIGKVILKI